METLNTLHDLEVGLERLERAEGEVAPRCGMVLRILHVRRRRVGDVAKKRDHDVRFGEVL